MPQSLVLRQTGSLSPADLTFLTGWGLCGVGYDQLSVVDVAIPLPFGTVGVPAQGFSTPPDLAAKDAGGERGAVIV
jgi:hypothetical protein